MYGSLKDFFTSFKAAPSLAGASVVFGEESIPAQSQALPLVVVVPQGGPIKKGQGMPVKNLPLGTSRIWQVAEAVDILIWTKASGTHALPIDHADAVEDVAAFVLQALEYQRPQGLNYEATGRAWATLENGQSRLGRALKLSIRLDVSVVNVAPPTATVTGLVVNDSIAGEASTS